MATIILGANENFTLASGQNTIYADTTPQTITVEAGASVTFQAGSVGDTIVLAGNAAGYTAVLSGNQVTLKDTATGATIVLPAGTTATSVSFDDGAYDLVLDTTGETPAITLGGTAVTDTETTVTGEPVEPPVEPPTFELTASNTNLVAEGQEISFTVTPSVASDTETTLYVQISGAAVGAITAQATADDFSAMLLPVTIPAGSTEPVVVSATVNADAVTEGPEGFQAKLLDSSFNVVADAAAVTGTITEGVSSGQTFMLTENVEVTNGNSGDNTFNAYTKFVAAVGQMNTLQSGDVVNGGEGNDTLIAESTGTTTIAATLNSVENLRLTSYGATTIEGANATGLKSVSIENSVNASTVRNLSEVVELTVKNQTGGNDVTIGYTDTALTGTNVQKLTLNNVTMKAAGGRILFDDNNGAGTLEQLDIAVTGASDIAGIRDIAGTNVLDGVATVNVNATAKADLGVIGAAKMTTFDASASTAGVTADVSAATGNDLAIKGGEGDDVITFGATANLTAKDSVDLGAGANTLRITGAANGTSYNVKNVQTLEVTTDGANQVNAEAFGAGVSTIGFVSAVNTHTGQVNNLADGATVAAKDATGVVNTLAALTINGKNTSGSTDSVTVKLFSNDEGTASTPSVFTVTTLTAGGYENVKLVSEGKANTANAVTTLTATAQKTVTIEGDKKLTVGNTLSATTVDATASTGGVDLTLAGTAVSGGKQTATGGTGNDTFRIDADVINKDIKIDGGEGTDTLVLTKTAAGNIDLTGVTNAELISGVSGFENLSFGGKVLLIDDATLNRFTDKTINVVEKGAAATTLNASAVLGSTSKLNVDASEMTTAGFTFAISNGIDGFKGSAQVDTIVVGASAYLTDADVLNGGAGNNNVFDFDTTGAAKQIVTASQLTNVSNFNTWNIKDTAAAANEFELTVTNAVAAQNINSTNNTLTISAATNGSDKVTIDASDVGSAYKLIVSTGIGAGAAAAQTVKLGAGDDTITLNSAVAGATVNTVTLGGGKDTVEFAGATAKAAATATSGLLSNNVIKDFSFGTATGTGANVDKLDLGAFGIVAAAAATGGIGKAGTTGDFQVVVLNDVSYDTQQAVDTAVKAIATGNAVGDSVVVFWQDSLGRVQVGVDLDATDDTAATFATTGVGTLGVLEGVTITGVAANIDLGDLILV